MSFDAASIFLLAGLLLCTGLCLYRLGRGPSAPDRMAAVDIIGTLVVGFVAIVTVTSGKEYLLTVAIVWAMISFVGTLALSKYLAGRQLDE